VAGDRHPAEMQPGVEINFDTPCFDWETKKFVSEDACGLGSTAPTDAAFAYVNGTKIDSGKTITISAKDDVPSSQYVDVALSVFGANATESSTGTYFIDGEEYTFTNREVIRIGEKVTAADTENGEEPTVITLKVVYNNAESTYTIKKVKYTKPVAKTDFSWDNALVYFVMTDRFYNADKSNDNSFGRPAKDATGHATATFHGGDIKGMTERLDYIKSLGMNAIWITAPYEQAHGWTGGGKTGAFAHWGYHGYYALDFTAMDPNVGTIDEFRTFVTEAHKRGIRVVLDIVMNHSGYATLQDMCDFNFGKTKNGWDPCKAWTPNGGDMWHGKPIDESRDASWDNWWGSSWLIFGGYGDACGAGDGLDACVSYLPDFKNSNPTGPQVSVPTFLKNKWAKANAKYDVPAAIPHRSGSMSVAQFEAKWLAAWVEEFGIDGFRCDTAKHVTKPSWKLLHTEAQAALKKWRENNANGDDPAAAWTDDFWMTGEHWGFGKDPSDNSGYASTGGFMSMINFSLGCTTPNESTWKDYGKDYGLGGASPKLNALSYVSSHDTALCRPGDNKALGTGLLLLPGGVQIYYGDETARPNDNGGSGNDQEHGTRSDMNFPSDIDNASEWAQNADTLSTSFSSNESLAHWQKIGQFRARNVAFGAGKLSETADGSHCRTYNNAEKNIVNSVVIHVGSASTVNVGSCFEDGTELQDGYSGATGVVSGGSVSLSGTGNLILLELKR
jgi:glycosidase